LGLWGGGLGGGALGLEGRVVAMEAGLFEEAFLEAIRGAVIEAVVEVLLGFFRGCIGGGGALVFFLL